MNIEDICKEFNLEDIGDFSDGFHTFNDLYYQRLVLFATIVNLNKDICWKTKKHEDGVPCFGGGWFLVTIETPEGAYGYHYKEEYWDMFKCQELEKAKHWDGYTDKNVGRLLSLASCNKSEQVDHPAHYNQPGRKECIDEMVEIFGDENVCKWTIMTAYKYLYRAGNKEGNSCDQDKKKAQWYLNWAGKYIHDLKVDPSHKNYPWWRQTYHYLKDYKRKVEEILKGKKDEANDE